MLWIGILVLVLVVAAAYIIRKRARAAACPHCGKSFAMREVSRDKAPVSSYDTTANIGLFTRDLKGNITAADAHSVPATAHVYKCVDACKFCGFEKEELRTEIRQK